MKIHDIKCYTIVLYFAYCIFASKSISFFAEFLPYYKTIQITYLSQHLHLKNNKKYELL